MIDIDTLRQRVEAAERTVGQYHSRDEEYGQRLISLFGSIEERLLEQRDQLRQRDGQIKTLEHQNRELRAMLHALLLAVEDGGRGRVGTAVGELEKRVSALVGELRVAAEAVSGTAPEPLGQTASIEAAEPETGSGEPPAAADSAAIEVEAEEDLVVQAAVSRADDHGGPDEAPDPLAVTDIDLEVGSAGPLEASQALEYGIEEEPDLALPVDGLDEPVPAGDAADRADAPATTPAQPAGAAADDEARRMALINELLGESDDPSPPQAPPEEPEQAAPAAATAGEPPEEKAAAPRSNPEIDDSVQKIIDRVSRLVSDLSEQEQADSQQRQVSAA